MAVSVTNIGTNESTGCVTLGSVTVPSGATSIVFVFDNVGVGAGAETLSDGGTNTYTKIAAKACGSGARLLKFLTVFYSANVSALTGATLTYNNSSSTSGDSCISACYATGLDTSPLDSAVTATAAGSQAQGQASVTSGTPSLAGELIVAGVGWVQGDTSAAYSQASGFSTPPNSKITASAVSQFGGGNVVNAGTGTKTFAPTIGGGNSWDSSALIIIGFKTQGALFVPDNDITAQIIAARNRSSRFVPY